MITPYKPDDILPQYPTVLDIETRSNGSVMAIGLAWSDENNNRSYQVFHSWQEFIDFYIKLFKEVKDKKKITRIFAHNGGNFDWLSLIQFINTSGVGEFHHGILSNSKMIGGTIKLNGVKNQIKLMDSLCLLLSGLKSLTSMFAIEHKKLDLGDKRLPEQVYAEDQNLFYKYLEHDVKGLQETLYEFWKYLYEQEGSIGQLPLTMASLALKLWRKDLTDNIMVSWNDKIKEFERRSYTGGRVELFEPGIHLYTQVHDINSLYPTVMSYGEFPVSYQGGWTYSYEQGDFGLFEIEYEQANKFYPPVLRDEQSKEFSYKGSGVYTHLEIEKMLTLDGSMKVIKGYVYFQHENLFKPFIEKWYARRKDHKANGNAGLEYICKILMNSLYGKFGQKETGHSIRPVSKENIEKWFDTNTTFIEYGDYAVIEEETQVEHSFAAIAAYVTSYARLKLFEYQQAIIDNGERLFYVDTDSVHHSGYMIPESKELGGMKKEFTGIGIYLARKLYQLQNEKDRKVVAKGIGKSAHHNLSSEDFMRIALEKDYSKVIWFPVAPTPKEVLLNGLQSCQFFERHRTVQHTKKSSEYVAKG